MSVKQEKSVSFNGQTFSLFLNGAHIYQTYLSLSKDQHI